MDLILDGLWKTSSLGVNYSPLALVCSIQNQVRSAPQRLFDNLYTSRVVNYALETAANTSPAEVIATVFQPVRSPKTDKIINEIREKAPIVDDIWEKLHVTPSEWYNYFLGSLEPHPNEDIGLTTVEMIKRNGYPVEEYNNVLTEDGYLLELYRIPHGLINKSDFPKPVVFLVHGYMSSSADYLMAGPDRALAYLLADKGYDVWLGNPRGSMYSRKHIAHDPDSDKEFWDFSFHEIGIYDLPAMINVILDVTDQQSLTYVGMSQGTAVFFTLASERPEYNNCINLMVALAPVVYNSKTLGLINKLGPFLRTFLNNAISLIGAREFPGKKVQKLFAALTSRCHSKGLFQDIAIHFLFSTFGYNYEQLDTDVLPVLMSTIPHTSSTNQLLHYGQMAISEKFQKFDYGPKGNLEKYGMPEPPHYDLSKINTPVAIFYSTGDRLSKPEDVMRLHGELPNCVHLHKIEDPRFSHMDYVVAKDVARLLNQHVIKVIEEYNPL